jgi:hypothetical protein
MSLRNYGFLSIFSYQPEAIAVKKRGDDAISVVASPLDQMVQ